MSYKKLHGTHHTKSVEHFFPIMKTLQKIHDQKMVHGDVRMANLVFGGNEDTSWIIDFDMANREGTSYCPGYKSKSADIPERHEDARESKPMLPSHDRYSLAVLMEQCIPLNCHASGVTLTIWSVISRSHAQGIESHAYQQ